MWHLLSNLIDLRHGAVSIVHALDGQQGGLNVVQQRANVEASKFFTQPHIVPLPKRHIDIFVKRRKPRL